MAATVLDLLFNDILPIGGGLYLVALGFWIMRRKSRQEADG